MAFDKSLRNNHNSILESLKKSQEQLSKLIITTKHSNYNCVPNVLKAESKNCMLPSKISLNQAEKITTNNEDYELGSGDFLRTKTTKISRETEEIKTKRKPKRTNRRSILLHEKTKQVTKKIVSMNDVNLNKKQTKLLENSDNLRPYNSQTNIKNKLKATKSILKENSNKIFKEDSACESIDETATPPLDSDENKSLKTVETPNKPVKTSKRPLLGYDWIAANMDNQLDGPCHGNVSAVEMSDHVIKELAEFRNSHKRECHSRGNWDRLVKTPKNPKTQLTKLPKLPQQLVRSPDPHNIYDNRIQNYTLNNRLFPIPLNFNDDGKTATRKSPKYIRVSIPKQAIKSPHIYKAKRKEEYKGGADSLALPDHCLHGWQHGGKKIKKIVRKNQGYSQDDSSIGLDLRSSIRPKDTLSKLQLNAGQFPDNGACDWTTDEDKNVLDQSYAVQLANQKLYTQCGSY